MIDQTALRLADDFADFYNRLLSQYPVYRLDGSWSSIGIVDLLLRPLRGRKIGDRELPLLRGASAYLARLAHDCWIRFPSPPKVSVRSESAAGLSIVIEAEGGELLAPGERVSVAVDQLLKNLLEEGYAAPLNCFREHSLPRSFDGNWLSLIAAGLACGQLPGVGPWHERSLEEVSPAIVAACSHLAAGTAKRYRRCYPLEEHGGQVQLYGTHALIPPLGYQEEFLVKRATAGMLHYFEAFSVSAQDIQSCALNLARDPDITVAASGCAIAAALIDPASAAKLQPMIEARGMIAPALRPAVGAVRAVLEREGDWLSLLEQGKVEAARQLAAMEYRLGLLPLVLSTTITGFGSKRLASAMEPLASMQASRARDALEVLSGETIESRLQLAHLDLYLNDLEQARVRLEAAAPIAAQNDGNVFAKEASAKYREICGRFCLAIGDHPAADKNFRQALESGYLDDRSASETALLLAQAAIEAGDLKLGEYCVSYARSRSPGSSAAAIAAAGLAEQCEDDSTFLNEISALVKTTPMHPQVFQLLLRHLLAGHREAAAAASP